MAPPGAPVFAPQEHAPDCVAAATPPQQLTPQIRDLPDPEIPAPHPAGEEAEPWLHEELNIKPGNVMRLEVSSEAEELYRCLLRYLGSRAVDVDEKIPRVDDALHDDPFCYEREFPGRLSSLFNSPRGTYLSFMLPPDKENEKGPREVDIMLGLGWAKVAIFGEGRVMASGKRRGKKLAGSDTKDGANKGDGKLNGIVDAGKDQKENGADKDVIGKAEESAMEAEENKGDTVASGAVAKDEGSQEIEPHSSTAPGEVQKEEVNAAAPDVDCNHKNSNECTANGTADGVVKIGPKDAAAHETSSDLAEPDCDAKIENDNTPNGKVDGVVENGITDAAAGGTKKAKKKKTTVKRHVVVNHNTYGKPIAVGAQSKIYRTLVLYGGSRDAVETLCRDALKWRKDRSVRRREAAPGRFVLHTLDLGCCGTQPEWISRGHQLSRSLKSVILPPGMMDAIVKDVSNFKADGVKTWYVDHGLPHRRSYLFYGPPGVGKTSTIRAIAGKLKLPACFLCLGDRRIGNRTLQQALETIPKPSILVMEDIDVLFAEDRKNKGPNFLTFSGLLNALDGMLSADGIVTVMTTNHVERLDPALIRAGRVDRKFEFKPPNTAQVADMFHRYYPNAERALAERFAGKVFDRKEMDARSIATLQLHFIRERKHTDKECVQRLDQFFQDFYPNAAHRNRQGLYM